MEITSMKGRVLAALEEDAKVLYAQIADRADVPKPAVRKCIRKLEDDGIIIGYPADISPKKLAGQFIAVVGIDVTSKRYIEITRVLKELDSVEALYIPSSDHMLMAEVRVADGDFLGDAISDEILSIDGVTTARPSFPRERLK